MPQGSCVKAWPRSAHQQDGSRGLTARAGRMAYQAGCGASGRGTGVGWWAAWRQRAPTPLVGRCAPWLYEWSFTGRAVCCRAPVASRVLLPLTARRGGGAHGGGRPLAAAGGCRLLWRFFFLLRRRNVILAGPRQGQASLRSVRQRTLDMVCSARIGACTCPMQINIAGSPVDHHRGKKP
jgi:hypothetical protein